MSDPERQNATDERLDGCTSTLLGDCIFIMDAQNHDAWVQATDWWERGSMR